MKKKLGKLRFSAIMIILLTLTLSLCLLYKSDEKYIEYSEYALNTIINFKLYTDKTTGELCIADLTKRLSEIEFIASAKNSVSELYTLNKNAAKIPIKVSETLFYLIERGFYYSELTGGAFDITLGKLIDLWAIGSEYARVPAQSEIDSILPFLGYENLVLDGISKTVYFKNENIKIDLGAIAKGYAGDEARRIITEHGIKNAVINLGGNVVVIGDKNGEGWNIGITDPKYPPDILRAINISDTSAVTSGNYERYFIESGKRFHHIFDRTTGYPSDSGIISATVITEISAEADALSTALFVMGKEKAEAFINVINIRAILISEDAEWMFGYE